MKILLKILLICTIFASCDKIGELEISSVELQVVNETDANLYDVIAGDNIDFAFVGAFETSDFKVINNLAEYNQYELSANIEGMRYSSINTNFYGCGILDCGSIFSASSGQAHPGKYQIVLTEFNENDLTFLVEFSKIN